jgi:hypothetical protein
MSNFEFNEAEAKYYLVATEPFEFRIPGASLNML